MPCHTKFTHGVSCRAKSYEKFFFLQTFCPYASGFCAGFVDNPFKKTYNIILEYFSRKHPKCGTEAEARERAFVCTASHDLVTPLMAVTANCDVLEAEASDQAGLASWVANIRAAADEMATRIADMLIHMGGD